MGAARPRAVRLRLGERSYPVRIGAGLLRDPHVIAAAAGVGAGPLWIVTDSNVARLHARGLARRLQRAGFRVHVSTVPAGEGSKSLRRLEALALEGIRAGLGRDAVLVALGGGMVGDLAGFLAGCYLRGISWIQIPTTLLAQVDASVGGKVAVNSGPYKNALGLFLQPRAVLADVEVLRTLPPREFRSGLAEAIKMAAVLSRQAFAWLEPRVAALSPRRPAGELIELVCRSVSLKARVVEADEKDRGPRALLNFGHTLAHALEGQSRYRGLLHGEAVAIGCAFAARLSEEWGLLSGGERRRLVGAFERAGLPTRVKACSADRLLELIRGDKKRSAKGLAVVLTGPLGDGSVRRLPDSAMLKAPLLAFLAEGR